MNLKTITQKHPPLALDELISGIKVFPDSDIEQKYEFISTLINIHPLLTVNWGKGSFYHRARNMENNSTPIGDVSEILCPPKEKRTFGRIDSNEHEILYMAYGRNTAFNELKISDNNFRYYAVATFEISETLNVFPIGELSRIQTTGRGILAGDASSSINGMLNSCSRNEAIRLLITDKFLSECLMGDDYNITSYVASCLFTKQPEISVIAYPSKQLIGGVNFAVKAPRIWDSMGINAIRYTQARHLACGYFEEKNTRHVIGIKHSGSLVWEDHNLGDEYYTELLEPIWKPDFR